eukprot:TRINITY_DN6289_c0_g1_i3.p1 TRINITY_DN6289_c0_g1~~TRINITY_DN6289_c0_g1_i3.p1  ORF type:complete len:119 (-),score=42.05 TRINITY_DN6289_c0_g1_i3:2-358(-)
MLTSYCNYQCDEETETVDETMTNNIYSDFPGFSSSQENFATAWKNPEWHKELSKFVAFALQAISKGANELCGLWGLMKIVDTRDEKEEEIVPTVTSAGVKQRPIETATASLDEMLMVG